MGLLRCWRGSLAPLVAAGGEVEVYVLVRWGEISRELRGGSCGGGGGGVWFGGRPRGGCGFDVGAGGAAERMMPGGAAARADGWLDVFFGMLPLTL